jgi:hypothetical protein
MQYGGAYDQLYKEVIEPVSRRLGFQALRADDVFRPGVILQSDVIVAEITPVNANVFYELGYAHAPEKPTILLANRKTEKLPFDISGYRVIFYDDTIAGKGEVETTLMKHLQSIRANYGLKAKIYRSVRPASERPPCLYANPETPERLAMGRAAVRRP